jgi:hypothetical protein
MSEFKSNRKQHTSGTKTKSMNSHSGAAKAKPAMVHGTAPKVAGAGGKGGKGNKG